MFRPKPGERYDMPVVFGPSLYKPVTKVPELEMISTSFATTREAAESLLPHYYKLPEGDPVMYVNRLTYKGIDYLGGREYREILVGVDAVFDNGKERLQAPYLPVVWVSEVAALIPGRELQGYPKLHADLPPCVEGPNSRRFEASEYGATLLTASVSGMTPLSEQALAKMKAARDTSHSFAWKYIPGIGEEPDVDYPTLLTMYWDYKKAWTGNGEISFATPDDLAAPSSGRVVRTLAKFPVKEMRKAFVAVASAEIHRGAVRRLVP